MFVITRREGEEIWVGDPRDPLVKIKIESIKESGDTGRVRVSIDAPRQMDVHRAEVVKKILDDGPGESGTLVPQ